MSRLPPLNTTPTALEGFQVVSYTVGSWCPNQTGDGKPEAVGVSFQVEVSPGWRPIDIVLVLKSRDAANDLIDMLARHRNDVWPEGAASETEVRSYLEGRQNPLPKEGK